MAKNVAKQLYILSRSARWRPANALGGIQVDPRIWQWITDEHSLTQRLMDVANGEFTVDLLRQTIDIPIYHEQDSLGQAHHLAATVREVCLNIYGRPIVLARSIIPLELIRQHQNGLTSLGRKPLGQLLFKEGEVRIARRQFTAITTCEETIYGRRTPYQYRGSTILVCEFYLPRIMDFELPNS